MIPGDVSPVSYLPVEADLRRLGQKWIPRRSEALSYKYCFESTYKGDHLC